MGVKRPLGYHTWMAMRRRCTDENFEGYNRIGGRGITVCERWFNSFDAFVADMGQRPPGMAINRIDRTRGYEPGNCRWSTRTERNRNRSSVKVSPRRAVQIRWLVEGGMLHKEIAAVFGLSLGMVSHAAYGTAWRTDGQAPANLRRRTWGRRASAGSRAAAPPRG